MRLQPFSVKVRGEISFQLFRERGKKKKTAKHSIRALARCAKHIGAWRGSDRRGVNRRANCGAAAPVGGKRGVEMSEGASLGNGFTDDSSHALFALWWSGKRKAVCLRSTWAARAASSNYPSVVKLLHVSSLQRQRGEDLVICIFMHFKACGIYRSHASWGKFVQRTEAEFRQWPWRRAAKCQREEQRGSAHLETEDVATVVLPRGRRKVGLWTWRLN